MLHLPLFIEALPSPALAVPRSANKSCAAMNKGIGTGLCPREQDVTGVTQTLSPAITAIVQFLEKLVVFGMFRGTSAALVSKKG